jgi:heme exporter protein A
MLKVRNLYDSRIKDSINNPINFHLNPGEVLAIKGKNGCGKTTLLRLISNIITPPDYTEIEINENHQYLGAKNGLFLNVKIYHYLTQTTEIFTENIINEEVYRLSTGMQRQLALTYLIQQQQQLWIIDEPTTHLDKMAKSLFYKELDHHIHAGGAALIATHDNTPSTIKILNMDSE